MKYCVVILLSSLLLSMVSERTSQAVASQLAFTNGEEVDWEDPIRTHTVLVVLGESEGYCTGVIISRTVALTAAHCVEGRKPQRVMLINDSGVSHSIPVRRYAAAPERKKGEPAHDIAVLFLARAVPSNYSPAKIERSAEAALQGGTVELVGYGALYRGLRRVELSLRRISASVAKVDHSRWLLQSGSGAIGGDSGSPVFIRNANAELNLVAIHTGVWTDTDAAELIYCIPIYPYLKWIDQEVAGH